MKWFEFEQQDKVASPALVLYKGRIEQNIDNYIGLCNDTKRLRPHVKTNKTKEVCAIMMQKGITKFKCATLAELEMLCSIRAKDVLLAYPLIGPNIEQLIELQKTYTNTDISFLVDNKMVVPILDKAFAAANTKGKVFIDVNVGMNRTGCAFDQIEELYNTIQLTENLSVIGFHAYDGHIHDGNPQERCAQSLTATAPLFRIKETIEDKSKQSLQLVIGGSPTFACYTHIKSVQLSPGTFVFWDYGYKMHYPELPFDYAALILTRVVSILDEHLVCLDSGHKAVASEMTQPRVAFLNLPETVIVSQSEEHLVVQVPDTTQIQIGQTIYAAPVHICPSVALHDKTYIVENNQLIGQWNVVARTRFLHLNH